MRESKSHISEKRKQSIFAAGMDERTQSSRLAKFDFARRRFEWLPSLHKARQGGQSNGLAHLSGESVGDGMCVKLGCAARRSSKWDHFALHSDPSPLPAKSGVAEPTAEAFRRHGDGSQQWRSFATIPRPRAKADEYCARPRSTHRTGSNRLSFLAVDFLATTDSQPRIDRYRPKYRSAMRSTVKRADTAARHAARSISPTRLIASTAASRLSTRKPVTPSSISSGIDPRLQAITGVPQASASTTDRPNGSSKLMRWSSARAEPRVLARAAPPTGPR